MQLKRLELHGFKTFADQTVIDFTPGITAVVGPNGSGKSNISDAILWALGEQNVRNIRAQKNNDVIFSGTDKRRALGLAEVSLTVDNSSGKIPLPYDEVTITRRSYRTGENEYFVNKTACRLKDIYELFLDTGVGRHSYSIISQGQIDAVLSARSEDRRELLEEAAGVKKYRYRRKEACRKLEATTGNLVRVNDLLSELENQVEPLREQAEIAAQYREFTDRLRQIEIGMLIQDIKRRHAELSEANERLEKQQGEVQALQTRLDEKEAIRESAAGDLAILEEQLASSREEARLQDARVQELEGQFALLEEKQRSLVQSEISLNEDMDRLQERRNQLQARLVESQTQKVEGENLLAERLKLVEQRQVEVDRLQAELQTISASIEEKKTHYLELARDLAAKENTAELLRTRLLELENQKRKREEQRADIQVDLDTLTTSVDIHTQAITSGEETLATLAEKHAALEGQIKENQQERAEIISQLRETENELADKQGRLRTLTELAESYEGFYGGVRAVMSAVRDGKLDQGLRVVVDVIEIPAGQEMAFEAALGSSLQDIVSPSTRVAQEAIAYLKESQNGRATFLPLDGMRPPRETAVNLANQPGVIGYGCDLLKFDAKYRPAIEALLGRTLVLENLDAAIALSRNATGWGKIVTLDGEIIVPSGAITGGSRNAKGPNILGRKRETADLTTACRNLEASINGLRNAVAALDTAVQALGGDRDVAVKDTADLQKTVTDERHRLIEAKQRLESRQALLNAVETERQAADEAESVTRAQLEELEKAIEQSGRSHTDVDMFVHEAEQSIQKLIAQRDSAAQELTAARVGEGSLRERLQALDNTLRSIAKDIEETGDLHQLRAKQSLESLTAAESHTARREETLRNLQAARPLQQIAQEKLKSLDEKRKVLAENLRGYDTTLRQMREARDQAGQGQQETGLRQARLEVQLTQAGERLALEYEITVEEALRWDDDLDVRYGTAAEVGRLRKEIKDLGPVNIGAREEYQRVSERVEFLSTQKGDLDQARESIQKTILEIDNSTRDLFMETFHRVCQAFDDMFKRLFGGGRTEIVLTDPRDLLETGVEVIVQPPGKRLQNLQLLSGGERALTASALLFALLQIKASPFCVLDEVDAPLDDSNVHRFAEMLKDFAKDSQFIVITHNKATMEAANTLYGVTMPEPGISRLMGVKLGDL